MDSESIEQDPQKLIESLFLPILDQLIREHPLPWKVDMDWTWEVVASDGVIISKNMRQDEAKALIAYAERRVAQVEQVIEDGVRIAKDIVAGKGDRVESPPG